VKIKVKRKAIGTIAHTLMKGRASAPDSGAVTTRASLVIRRRV